MLRYLQDPKGTYMSKHVSTMSHVRLTSPSYPKEVGCLLSLLVTWVTYRYTTFKILIISLKMFNNYLQAKIQDVPPRTKVTCREMKT